MKKTTTLLFISLVLPVLCINTGTAQETPEQAQQQQAQQAQQAQQQAQQALQAQKQAQKQALQAQQAMQAQQQALQAQQQAQASEARAIKREVPARGFRERGVEGDSAENAPKPETATQKNAQTAEANVENRQTTRQDNQRDRRQDLHIARDNVADGTKETGEAAIRHRTRKDNQNIRHLNAKAAEASAEGRQETRQGRRTAVKTYHTTHPEPR